MSRFPVVVQFEFGRRSAWPNDCDQNPPRDWKVFTIPPLQTPALGKIRHDVCLRCRGDIGKELRKTNPDPHFLQNHQQWLKKFGREKVHDQITTAVTIRKLCENMDDF
jgi:hypothetical protein